MVIVWFNMVQNPIDYHTWLLNWLVVDQPTPLKNHGVKVSWGVLTFPTVSGES